MTLTKADKAVIAAFTEHRHASSKALSTDGHTLDGHWMGGSGIAHWSGNKIHFTDLGSKGAQTVQRAIAKEAPRNWLAQNPTAEQHRARGKERLDAAMRLYHRDNYDGAISQAAAAASDFSDAGDPTGAFNARDIARAAYVESQVHIPAPKQRNPSRSFLVGNPSSGSKQRSRGVRGYVAPLAVDVEIQVTPEFDESYVSSANYLIQMYNESWPDAAKAVRFAAELGGSGVQGRSGYLSFSRIRPAGARLDVNDPFASRPAFFRHKQWLGSFERKHGYRDRKK